MPCLTHQARERISEQDNDNTSETIDTQYVTIEAFNMMLQEIQSLKSLIQTVNHDQSDNDELIAVSEDTRSSSNTVSHYSSTNALVKSIYDNIPQYSGDGDIQRLLDFVDKVDDYLAIADISTPTMEIALITVKLMGTASLLWRHHKWMNGTSSPYHIEDWKGL